MYTLSTLRWRVSSASVPLVLANDGPAATAAAGSARLSRRHQNFFPGQSSSRLLRFFAERALPVAVLVRRCRLLPRANQRTMLSSVLNLFQMLRQFLSPVALLKGPLGHRQGTMHLQLFRHVLPRLLQLRLLRRLCLQSVSLLRRCRFALACALVIIRTMCPVG